MMSYNFDEDEELLQRLGAVEGQGEEGFTALERLWHRPTLEFTGIKGGWGRGGGIHRDKSGGWEGVHRDQGWVEFLGSRWEQVGLVRRLQAEVGGG